MDTAGEDIAVAYIGVSVGTAGCVASEPDAIHISLLMFTSWVMRGFSLRDSWKAFPDVALATEVTISAAEAAYRNDKAKRNDPETLTKLGY